MNKSMKKIKNFIRFITGYTFFRRIRLEERRKELDRQHELECLQRIEMGLIHQLWGAKGQQEDLIRGQLFRVRCKIDHIRNNS